MGTSFPLFSVQARCQRLLPIHNDPYVYAIQPETPSFNDRNIRYCPVFHYVQGGI
jgi:hypothetical protein